MTNIYADDPVKGQVCVGRLDQETGLLVKEVSRSKHYFGLVHGYALQKDAFDQVKKEGAKGIMIVERDTGHKLYADLATWEDKGGIWTGRNGKQRTLAEKYFNLVL